MISVYAIKNECDDSRIDIDVNLISKIRGTNTDAFFQFFNYKETDILWMNSISVANTGNCTIKDLAIFMQIKPEKGYTYANKHPPDYNDFFIPIPDLEKGKKVYISKNYFSGYYNYIMDNKTLNLSYWHWGLDLDEPGNWIIDYDVQNIRGRLFGTIGYNFRVNGQDIKWLRVLTVLEASLINYNEITNRYNRALLTLTYALFALTLVLTVIGGYSYWASKSQTKELRSIKNYLKSLSKDSKKK